MPNPWIDCNFQFTLVTYVLNLFQANAVLTATGLVGLSAF